MKLAECKSPKNTSDNQNGLKFKSMIAFLYLSQTQPFHYSLWWGCHVELTLILLSVRCTQAANITDLQTLTSMKYKLSHHQELPSQRVWAELLVLLLQILCSKILADFDICWPQQAMRLLQKTAGNVYLHIRLKLHLPFHLFKICLQMFVKALPWNQFIKSTCSVNTDQMVTSNVFTMHPPGLVWQKSEKCSKLQPLVN